MFVQDALQAQKTIKQDQDKLKELQFEQVEIDSTVEDLEPYLQQQTAYSVNKGLIESKQKELLQHKCLLFLPLLVQHFLSKIMKIQMEELKKRFED